MFALFRFNRRRIASIVFAVLCVPVATFYAISNQRQPVNGGLSATPKPGFAGRDGVHFILDGKPFYVAGVNNHYLTYGSPTEVSRVLDDAVAMGATVVRTFIQPVIGSPDGASPRTIWDWRNRACSSHLGVHGVYVAYWDSARNAMALNDGPNGLQKLDFLLDEARKRHIKLIIAFLDFWAYTGGAQQMRAWYGSEDKNTFFFADERTKKDYKELVRSILLRSNSINGVTYKNDETIFAWELMNEPGIKPESLMVSWISEMSSYVKSIDPDHLVTSGQANVSDDLSDIAIPSIDFATWHGYPLYYKMTVDDMDGLITKFCRIAARAGKPVLLEEFGYARSNSDQVYAYQKWLRTINHDANCAGWLVWRLVSLQDDFRYPTDNVDQFDVHNDGSALWSVLKEEASRISKKNMR